MPWDLMNSASNLFWFMRIMGRKIKKHTNAAESEKSFMLICDSLFEAILNINCYESTNNCKM